MSVRLIKRLLLVAALIFAIRLLGEIEFAYVTVLPVAVGIWWLLIKTNASEDEE